MAAPTPPLHAPVATVVTAPPQVEYQLLVVPIFEPPGGVLRRAYRWIRRSIRQVLKRGALEFPVQNRPFRLGLDVTNVGSQVSPPCRVTGVQVGKAEPGGFRTLIREEFQIPNLNPRHTTRLWIGNMTTPIEGVVWVSAEVTPQAPNAYIKSFQKDQGTGEIEASGSVVNGWGVGWFIQPRLELQQARTNNLIALLTLLLVLEAVVGLKNMVVGLLHLLQGILLWAARLVGASP